FSSLQQFNENSECYTGVRTIEHASAVAQRGCISKFFFGSLLDDAVEKFESANGFLETDRITDLDGAREGLFGFDWFECFEVLQVGTIKRIGSLSLGDNNPGKLRD